MLAFAAQNPDANPFKLRKEQPDDVFAVAEPLTLAQMAEQAAMSERHFRRVFQQETGQSPSAFVETARLEAAKQLLETQSQWPLKTVAAHVGLGSEQALRQLFVRRLGITPVAYRERFGD